MLRRSVKDVIPYELFAILLYNERTRSLRMRYSIGHREEVANNLVDRLGEGITGAAAATRQPMLVSDVRRDPRYLNALDAVRAELAVPMLIRGKLVGIIDLQSHASTHSRSRTALLALIASRVGVAIDKRACIAAWNGRTAHCACWRISRRNSARFWNSTSC